MGSLRQQRAGESKLQVESKCLIRPDLSQWHADRHQIPSQLEVRLSQLTSTQRPGIPTSFFKMTYKMHWFKLLNMTRMAPGQCRQVYYEDKPVITRFTRRGTGNHRLIKTIFACQYARGMPNSHEVLFVSESGSSQSSSDSDNATTRAVPMAGSADEKVKLNFKLKASPSGAPLKLVRA